MPKMAIIIKKMASLKIQILLLLGISLTLLLPAPVNPAQMGDYCIIPPYVKRDVEPNIMIMLDNSQINGSPAYPVPTFQSYNPSIVYYGIFRSNINYVYGTNKWEPNVSGLSGNILNWASTSRYDLIESVLVGGKSASRQNQAQINTLIGYNSGTWETKTLNYTGTDGKRYTCDFTVNIGNKGNLTIADNSVALKLVPRQECGLILPTPVYPHPLNPNYSLNIFEKNYLYSYVDKEEKEKDGEGFLLSGIKKFVSNISTFIDDISNIFVPEAMAAQKVRIINPKPNFSLPDATQGSPYNYNVGCTATCQGSGGGCNGVFSYSATGLPNGLSMDTSCTITGTPNVIDPLPHTYTVTITVTDTGGTTDSVTGTITVNPAGGGGGGGGANSKDYNIAVCAGDYVTNCNNAGPGEVLKEGIIQYFWDQARFGEMSFSQQLNPNVEICIPANNDNNYYNAIENAVPVGDVSNITKLVNGEYEAIRMYQGVANSAPSCDPLSGDTTICRKNFILMLTAGEGADNPPNPNAGAPNVFSDPDNKCTAYSYNLYKNACYGYLYDIRTDIDGKQNTLTYIVNAMGVNRQILEAAATGGGGKYYHVDNPILLKQTLIQAFQDILQRAASGTAASVLASGEGRGANLIQAVFYPRTQTTKIGGRFGEEIWWIGQLKNLWYYIDPKFESSSIREETDGNTTLNLINDYIAQLYFDAANERTMARRAIDTDGDGDADTAVTPDIIFESLGNLWEAGVELWKRDISTNKRKIYTTINGTSFLPGNFSADTNNGDLDNSATLRPYFGLPAIDSEPDGFLDGDLDHDGDVDNTDASILIRYIHGEDFPTYTWLRSRTTAFDLNGDGDTSDANEGARVWKLGDIINSTPRISSWLKLNTYDEIYNDTTYKNFIKDKLDDDSPNPKPVYTNRGMVFTGANDGMLHAFKLGLLTITEEEGNPVKASMTNPDPSTPLGHEVWAFIPKNVLPYLKYIKENAYCHLYSIDLSPYIFDASIGQKSVGDISNNIRNVSSWRTILIGGMRFGGACRGSNTVCSDVSGDGSKDCVNAPGVDLNGDGDTNDPGEDTIGLSTYFAIDVTDQNNPELLWEFTDTSLGFSTTSPAVIRIGDYDKNGKWFAIFGSGPTGPIDTDAQQFLGRSDQNLRLFVLDLKTGTLLRTIDTGIQYAFAGSMLNVSNDSDLNYQDEAVYIGYVKRTSTTPYTWTGGGVIRLITKEDPNPNNWVWSLVIDNIGPVTSSIAKLQKNRGCYTSTGEGCLWLYFGTGRYFYERQAEVDDATNQRRLFAIKEPCFSTKTDGKGYIDYNCTSTVASGDLTNVTDIANVPDEGTANGASFKGWYINLDLCTDSLGNTVDCGSPNVYYWVERIITDPSATTSGLIFFATFKPYNDICTYGGKTFLWAMRYNTGGAGALLLKGKVVVQVSTGSIEQISLPEAFVEKGGRRTAAIEGVPPTASGMTILTSPPPVKRILHRRER